MALGHKSIQSRWTRRHWLILASLMFVILALAWFDGGEEPLHQIVQDVPVPEGR